MSMKILATLKEGCRLVAIEDGMENISRDVSLANKELKAIKTVQKADSDMQIFSIPTSLIKELCHQLTSYYKII